MAQPTPTGHEYVGVVTGIGDEVKNIEVGDFVVGSFMASDNTCEICAAGYQSRCAHVEFVGAGGAQAEYLRVPLADGTVVATPAVPDDDLIPSLLAASDVLGSGWFGAVAAEAGPGKTVAVVGDGAVGLLAVLAAKQLGADRIIAMSRHASRQKLAIEFGATEVVEERGGAGVAKVKELTGGYGAHSVIEAVGTQESTVASTKTFSRRHPQPRHQRPSHRRPAHPPGTRRRRPRTRPAVRAAWTGLVHVGQRPAPSAQRPAPRAHRPPRWCSRPLSRTRSSARPRGPNRPASSTWWPPAPAALTSPCTILGATRSKRSSPLARAPAVGDQRQQQVRSQSRCTPSPSSP